VSPSPTVLTPGLLPACASEAYCEANSKSQVPGIANLAEQILQLQQQQSSGQGQQGDGGSAAVRMMNLELDNLTSNTPLASTDLRRVNTYLEALINISQSSGTSFEAFVDINVVLSIISNVLNPINTCGWLCISESRKGPSRLLFNIERIAAIIGQDVLRDMVYVQRNIGELCSTLVIQWYIPLCPGHFGTSTVLIIKISSFQGLKLFHITE
jgi:hypothetical protein